MDSVIQDVRYALRALRRSLAFTVVAVAAIAIGAGAVTTIFSAVDALLLSPVPGVGDPERVVSLGRTEGGAGWRSFSYPLYRNLRDRARSLDGAAAFSLAPAVFSRTSSGEGEQVVAQLVSGNYFDVLRAHPAVGRFFTAEEDSTPMARPVVVLGHRLWRDRFAGDPAVVGRDVSVNGRSFTVVGVAAPEFGGAIAMVRTDLYVPLMMQGVLRGGGADPALFADWGGSWLQVVGHLRPGVSADAAAAELSADAKQAFVDHDQDPRPVGVRVVALRAAPGWLRGPVLAFMAVLTTVAALVLLIASMNVANMLLARAVARRRDVAVRLAVGASRWRLVRQLLAESLVLWLLGGVAGVVLALWGTGLLERFSPSIDGFHIEMRFGVDGLVLGVALLTSLVSGVVFGLLPALQASRCDLASVLRTVGGAGERRGRMRDVLVVGQLAMSVLLLVAAGLFLRALDRGRRVDPGFQVDGVAVAPLDVGKLGYDGARAWDLYRRLAARMAAMPGVGGVGYTSLVPLALNDAEREIQIPGQTPPPGTEHILVGYHEVAGDYFRTMRMPIERGRAFTGADAPDAPKVAVVNESFARRYWPGGDALGRTIVLDDATYTVVGVARDARMRSLADPPVPFLFVSAEQRLNLAPTLLVRADAYPGGSSALAAAVRREARALEPRIPLPAVQRMKDVVSIGLLPQRAAAAVTGSLGVVGLLLAALGLYGVVAYSVAQRTREIGVRIALGAAPRDVVRMVVGQSARLAGAGVAVGIALAIAASRALVPLLYGVSALDPITLGGVPLVLTAVAVAASWVPARRAAAVEASVTLRAE